MAYNIDPNLEYFLGISLPKNESKLLTQIRQKLENRDVLSSPPHVTIKPPFTYHFEKPLLEQLGKWAKQQRPFTVEFKKIGTFKHEKYSTVFLAPEKGKPIKKIEQSLSETIRFLPEETNYIPHLTIVNRVDHQNLEKIKEIIRALDISLELSINNITLYEHQRLKPWVVKEIFYF